MQKTFSVALSRDMVPSAHIVAYYLHQGEILADSLNFFVNGTRQNPVGTHTGATCIYNYDMLRDICTRTSYILDWFSTLLPEFSRYRHLI